MSREGWVLPIPQPKDRCYLYMPNPAIIHKQSSRLQHFLGIADIYLDAGCPEIYEVEPDVSDDYRPDAYLRTPEPVIVEYQRTRISEKRMQDKADLFVATYKQGKHDAKTLWIVADHTYHVDLPPGFQVQHKKPPAIE